MIKKRVQFTLYFLVPFSAAIALLLTAPSDSAIFAIMYVTVCIMLFICTKWPMLL